MFIDDQGGPLMTTHYEVGKLFDFKKVLNLYHDANWTNYTDDVNKLKRAINNSLLVITAWENEKLVGLIRTVGDKESISYIQDLLVLKEYQRCGIGKALVREVQKLTKNIRMTVLLTDESKKTRKFYESLGFSSCDKGQTVAFLQIN